MTAFDQQWLDLQEAERKARGEQRKLDAANGGPMIHRDSAGGYDLPTKGREHGTEHRTVDSVMVNRAELERLRRSDEALRRILADGAGQS